MLSVANEPIVLSVVMVNVVMLSVVAPIHSVVNFKRVVFSEYAMTVAKSS
jgi:hypothetical protein